MITTIICMHHKRSVFKCIFYLTSEHRDIKQRINLHVPFRKTLLSLQSFHVIRLVDSQDMDGPSASG